MKALLTRSVGTLDGLYVGEAAEPAPGPGEILVEVRAAGVNAADWKIVEMGFPGWRPPKAIGLDAAGVVVATGPGTADFAPGDRVYYHGSFAGLGAFAERVVTPSHVVALLPESVSFEAAAALPTAGFTAFQVVEDRLAPGPYLHPGYKRNWQARQDHHFEFRRLPAASDRHCARLLDIGVQFRPRFPGRAPGLCVEAGFMGER